MSDALLRTILADPSDLTARLVYADWLEESGQSERAELIRLQVRDYPSAPRPKHKERFIYRCACPRCKAGSRILQLVNVHVRDWFAVPWRGEPPTVGYHHWTDWRDRSPSGPDDGVALECGGATLHVRNGFVEQLRAELPDLMSRHWLPLFAHWPIRVVVGPQPLPTAVSGLDGARTVVEDRSGNGKFWSWRPVRASGRRPLPRGRLPESITEQLRPHLLCRSPLTEWAPWPTYVNYFDAVTDVSRVFVRRGRVFARLEEAR